jgi:hypothetical protein
MNTPLLLLFSFVVWIHGTGGLHSKQRFIKLKRDSHARTREEDGYQELRQAQAAEIEALQQKHAQDLMAFQSAPQQALANEQFVLNVFDESSVPAVEAFLGQLRKLSTTKKIPVDILVGHSLDMHALSQLRKFGCPIKFHSKKWQGGVTVPGSLPAASVLEITRVSAIVQSLLESKSMRTVQLSFASGWSYSPMPKISTLFSQNASVSLQPGPLFHGDAPFIDSGVFGGWEDFAVMAVHTGNRRVKQALVTGFREYVKGAARVAYPLMSPKPAFRLSFLYGAGISTGDIQLSTLRQICHYPEPPIDGSECHLVIRCISSKCGKLGKFRAEHTQSLHGKRKKIADMLMPEKPWGLETAWKLLGGGEAANTITTSEIPMYATRACLKIMETCFTPKVMDKASHTVVAKAKSKYKVVMLTLDELNSVLNDQEFALNKQLYAAVHGYRYIYSNYDMHYKQYFSGAHIDGNAGTYLGRYGNWFGKTTMVLAAMLENPEAEWFMYLDSDTWINPLFMNQPLDLFLDTIPPDKIYVHSNFRFMSASVFMIRNNAEGRRLLLRWLGNALSGNIQCHAGDGGALQLLFFNMLNSSDVAKPYNFSCIHPSCGCQDAAEQWSCDYAFEHLMSRNGYCRYDTEQECHDNLDNSYSRGEANDKIKSFHVLAESKILPRFQCCKLN